MCQAGLLLNRSQRVTERTHVNTCLAHDGGGRPCQDLRILHRGLEIRRGLESRQAHSGHFVRHHRRVVHRRVELARRKHRKRASEVQRRLEQRQC